jgi:signal transduction histidine kinase
VRRRLRYDHVDMLEAEELKKTLGELVLSDIRRARATLLRALETDPDAVEMFLDMLTSAGDARLRSLIANIAKNYPQKQRFVPHLLKWRENESDEFTARAISSALVGVDERSYPKQGPSSKETQPGLLDVYRYVSDRLRHRLRNALFAAQGYTLELKSLLMSGDVAEAAAAVARLNDAMVTVARALESIDVDPEYFVQRPIRIVDWLRAMNQRYASQYPAVRLVIDNGEGRWSPVVLASDYLLETVFWNLWTNAHQFVGPTCEITAVIRTKGGVEILLVDNGVGFAEGLVGIAFSQQYSSFKSLQRGRGLLEVAEAVERLGGSVGLVERRPNEFRVQIILPERSTV